MKSNNGLVYLAGPITGLSYGESVDWRDEAMGLLRHGPRPLRGLSPMRAKSYLAGERRITGSYEDTALSSKKGITARDRWDVERCDVVLMNLLGAESVSIGTMIEAGWADSYRKPVVLVIEENGNVNDHPILREIGGFHVGTLEAGVNIVRALLL